MAKMQSLPTRAIYEYNKLIDRYNELKAKEAKETERLFSAMYRDEMRKISKIFEKTFHKPIDNAEKI